MEFYAGGNIILTDKELNVIGVLRTVNEGAEHEHVRLGSVYNLSERQNINGVPELTEERVKTGLQGYVDKMAAFAQQTPAKKSKKKSNDMLRKALASCVSEFPPPLLDHVLQVVNIDAQVQPQDVIEKQDVLKRVMDALHQAQGIVQECMSKPVGYIIAKRKSEGENESTHPPKREDLLYDDYYPFKPKQFLDDSAIHIVDFDSFNKAVDDFYSSIEGQKLESKLQEKEEQARKKLEHAKQDQERRIGSLQQVQELNVRKAQAIEANLARVEEATAAINGLIAQGMDWVEIDRLIELEQKKQNPVAELIKLPLKLNENTATLLLAEWEEDDDVEGDDLTDEETEDSEEETQSRKATKPEPKRVDDKRLTVDIDLALSGYSNAREYYEQRRNAAAKQEKTVQASEKALKSQTQKIETDLKKALKQEKTVLRAVRKPFWFEKFIYFISSDGYLVLGGKDLQQNDILYKKYLKKGDIFVHADLNGAAPVIIKNNPATPNAEIPPSTLSQAGNLSIATSSAWESKAVMSAWWVPSEQVSKTAPSGDYMQPGTFHIKGKKQFLPPAQLLLGFAIMFQISAESKARHLKHRLQDPVPVKDNTAENDQEESHSALEAAQNTTGQASQDEDEAQEEIPEETDDEEEEDEEEQHVDGDDRERKYTNPLGDHATPSTAADTTQVDSESSDDEDEDQNETKTTTEVNDDISSDTGSTVPKPTPNQPSAEPTDDESTTNHATGTSTPSSSAKPQTNAPLTRGKRAKAKRLAQKYADQDEEDRQLAMQLLGSSAGANKAAAEAAAREQKEQQAQAAKARRKEIAEKAQKAGLEREMKRLMEQENGEEEEDEGESAAVDIDALVGTLLAGDEVVAAIPICAPWTALGKHKYRAKLQPGSTKKGKAVREILGRWNKDAENKKNVDEKGEDQERIWPREVECLKEMKEREEAAFGVVPVRGVRVMMGGKAGTSGGGSGGSKAKGGRGGRGKKR